MEISRIHYLVHPLWQLDVNRDATSELVEKLIELGEKEGKDVGTLFILEMNGSDHYFENEDDYEEHLKEENGLSYDEAKKQAISDYFRLGGDLTDGLRKRCNNLFLGNPAWLVGKKGESELDDHFQRYIQRHQVVFTDGCDVVSHGADVDACIPDRSQTLVDAINSTYGSELTYRINQETSL